MVNYAWIGRSRGKLWWRTGRHSVQSKGNPPPLSVEKSDEGKTDPTAGEVKGKLRQRSESYCFTSTVEGRRVLCAFIRMAGSVQWVSRRCLHQHPQFFFCFVFVAFYFVPPFCLRCVLRFNYFCRYLKKRTFFFPCFDTRGNAASDPIFSTQYPLFFLLCFIVGLGLGWGGFFVLSQLFGGV